MERAVDWLFSHSDDLNSADDAINDVGAAVASPGEQDNTGPEGMTHYCRDLYNVPARADYQAHP